MSQLRYGQVVLAHVGDGHGNCWARPVVIVTPTDLIDEQTPLTVVCISTQIEKPSPPEHVRLPWHRTRRPRTGLDKPNVAKCNWTTSIRQSDIVRSMGDVPWQKMMEIANILARLSSVQEGGDSGATITPAP